LSHDVKVRVFQKSDYDKVKEFISDIIVNELKFKLEFDNLDVDILTIDETYSTLNRSCFWVAQTIVDNDTKTQRKKRQRIVGTAAIRNLKQFESTCELSVCMYERALDG
jgi:hypothetical protein